MLSTDPHLIRRDAVPDRPPAFFIADSLGLDFLNSIATPVDQPIDWLDSGDGFVGWLAQANLVPPQALNALIKQATPGELDKVADQARALREWFRGFVRKHMGRPLTPKAFRDLKPLNALLERDEMFSRVAAHEDSNGHHLELQTTRRWRSPEFLLLPIGEALARCVCDEAFADIRACEGHRCTLIFADHTRRRGRRWCSMAMCGNRAKQAAHRHRVKAER
ncbi:MAG TPA: ABATE domain-containing protein [Candidatus Dormibacteraeota bacterium]|nr:ABATE domain-containing protein [Candidatus Dormibacteraeota bacterium]